MATVAILLSCDSFESFYGKVLGLDRARYLSDYRNDWSWYYAKGLLDNGHRPILYIPSIRESGFFETDAGISVRFLQCDRWYEPLAPFRRAFRATRWSLYLQERVNAMSFVETLNVALLKDGAEVLLNQEYWNGRFDHLAHRVRTPVAAIDQGNIPDGVVKTFKRRAVTRAGALFCQTLNEREHVHRYGGKTHLQPNGVDTDYFHPPGPETVRQKTILTVARLTDKQKLTSDLIRAMQVLSPDWTLKIVGTGPDHQMLQDLATQLGVAQRVEFMGFRNRDDIRALNQQCGVYAMPSSNEGMCVAVLEAMACGAAVVATRIRSFEFMIEHGTSGLLVPVGDPHALAAAIDRAWQHRDALGAEAVTTINAHFNAKVLYRRLAQTLQAIASRGPGRPTTERASLPSEMVATGLAAGGVE